MAAERRAVILGPHDRAAAVEAKSRDPERRRTLAGTDGSNTLFIEPAYDDSWAVPLAPWWFAEYVPMRRDVWGRALESWQPGELTRVHAATGPLWEHLVGGRLTADGDPAVPYGTTAVVSHVMPPFRGCSRACKAHLLCNWCGGELQLSNTDWGDRTALIPPCCADSGAQATRYVHKRVLGSEPTGSLAEAGHCCRHSPSAFDALPGEEAALCRLCDDVEEAAKSADGAVKVEPPAPVA